MLCGNAGIEQVTLDNSTAYIQSWLKALRNDKRMIIYAAGQAQKQWTISWGRRKTLPSILQQYIVLQRIDKRNAKV